MTNSLIRESQLAGGVRMIENDVRARSVNATSHEYQSVSQATKICRR